MDRSPPARADEHAISHFLCLIGARRCIGASNGGLASAMPTTTTAVAARLAMSTFGRVGVSFSASLTSQVPIRADVRAHACMAVNPSILLDGRRTYVYVQLYILMVST